MREEALSTIEEMVLNKNRMQDDDAFVNSVGAVYFTILDKMAGVSNRAMSLLSTVCRHFKSVSLNSSLRNQVNTYQDTILSYLSNKIGDNLVKVRQSSEEALLAMVAHPAFAVKNCLYYVVNEVPAPVTQGAGGKKPKKPVVSSKLLGAKY